MRYEIGIVPPWWLRGRPADLWIRHSQTVEAFVKEAKLKPIDQEFLATKLEVMVPQALEAAAKPTSRQILGPDIRGGMRLAHLHYKDDIFILNEEQWRAFSKSVITAFSTKLSKASAVSFDQLLDLSEAVDTL